MLALQRLAGNAATAAAIAAARASGGEQCAAAAAVGEPVERSRDGSPGEVVVQRDVGFEFQSDYWAPWRHLRKEERGAGRLTNRLLGRGDYGEGDQVEPLARKTPVHSGDGFTLEADAASDPIRSDLEFVTKPFHETANGQRQLRRTLDSMLNLAGRLEKAVGRPGPDLTLGGPPYSIGPGKFRNSFVRPVEHGLDGSPSMPARDLLLSGGRAEFPVKMQATAGLSLRSLPRMMEHLGRNVPGETAAQEAARKPYRDAFHPTSRPPTSELKFIGRAPALANTVIASLGQLEDYAQAVADNTSGLSGFLAALISSASMLQLTSRTPGTGGSRPDVVKYRLALMHRNNFVQMFDALPWVQQIAVKIAPDVLVDELVSVLRKEPGLGRLAKDRALIPPNPGPDAGPRDPSTGQRTYPPLAPDQALATLTFGSWIRGIVTGHDYLSQAGMERWLAATANFGAADKKAAVGALSSVGAVSTVGLDANSDDIFQFEHRAVNPVIDAIGEIQDLPLARAAENAMTIMEFYIRLREGF